MNLVLDVLADLRGIAPVDGLERRSRDNAVTKDTARLLTEPDKPNVVAGGNAIVAAAAPAIAPDFTAIERFDEAREVLPAPAIWIPCEKVGGHQRSSERGVLGVSRGIAGRKRRQ